MPTLDFLFTDEALQELEQLRKETGLETNGQLISVALNLFGWATNEVDDGGILLVENRTRKFFLGICYWESVKHREIIFPFWNPATREIGS